MSTDNRGVVAESCKRAPFKTTNVATQQLHGVGLSPKALLKRIVGPSAACFLLCGWDQHIEERVALARTDAPDRVCPHHRRVVVAKLNLASRMRNSESLRLG